ncbi:MAG: GTP-binding protein [Candidatus Lokiarchaeota archaeon]|nr:GTP-binding protein [Candidatus Lokiarchaeota archaeon]
MNKDKYKFKIAVLGEPDIGKSELNNLCTRHFDTNTEQIHEKLYGVSFAVQVLQSINVDITLVVWNFTGQDEYRKIQKRHLEGVSGVLLLFDLTRNKTFDKLPSWLEIVGLNIPNVPIILVGTKADKFQEKEVGDGDIENFFNNFKLQGYSEVSFKTGLNFESTIEMLAKSVFEYKTLEKKSFKELKIQNLRHGRNSPIILDESRAIESISYAIEEIIGMITDEINENISEIKKNSNKLEEKELKIKIEKLKNKIEDYDSKIKELNDQIPIVSSVFYNQINDWENRKDEFKKRLKAVSI